jgi:putative tryptophan/tyrosine transport system substrate-binding protein
MNNRRKVIVALAGALAAPFRSFAQQQGKVWRVGVLSIGSVSTAGHLVEAFFKGMSDLGYQEGGNVHYEVLYGEGSIDKFEQCAREHVSAKVDLIWASGTPAASAAQKQPRRSQSSSLSLAIPSIQSWSAALRPLEPNIQGCQAG